MLDALSFRIFCLSSSPRNLNFKVNKRIYSVWVWNMFSHTKCCGESRVLRQMFGLERGKAKGSCRKMYHEEFHKLYYWLNINRAIKLRMMSRTNGILRGGRKVIYLSTTGPLKWPTCSWKYSIITNLKDIGWKVHIQSERGGNVPDLVFRRSNTFYDQQTKRGIWIWIYASDRKKNSYSSEGEKLRAYQGILTENDEKASKIQATEINFLEASHNAAHYIKLKQMHTNNLNVYLTINKRDESRRKRLNSPDKWEPRHTGTCVWYTSKEHV